MVVLFIFLSELLQLCFIKIKQQNSNNRQDQINTPMNSPKQSTQKRMLGSKNLSSSPRFAKLAGRSPTAKMNSRKTQTKTSVGSQQSLRDSDTSLSLKKEKQIRQIIPQRITQNLEHKQIVYENKDRYEGGVRNGKLFGKGTYYFYSSDLKYVGQFYNDLVHGLGVLMKNYGNQFQSTIYEGNFEYGKKHGKGTYYYGPNHYYNGDWVNDFKEGNGMYFNNGDFYNGFWLRNKRHGDGSLKLKNSTEFKGTFKNDQFVQGLVRYPDGDQYSGQMLNGKRQGEGTYFDLKDQQRYKGQWKSGQKHGRGTIFFSNNDQKVCTLFNGKIDQTQSATYKWNTNQLKGSTFDGWFRDGKPQKGHVRLQSGEQYDIY